MTVAANSTQYATQLNGSMLSGMYSGSRLLKALASYTHSGASATGTVELIKLPQGRITVFDTSKMVTTPLAQGALLSVGFREYIEPNGTVVNEDDDIFLANADVFAFLENHNDTYGHFTFTAIKKGYIELQSRNGIVIFATIAGGNIVSGDEIHMVLDYSREN